MEQAQGGGVGQAPAGLWGQVRVVLSHRVSRREAATLRDGGFPITVLHGRHDLLASRAAGGRLAARLGAAYVEIEGAHFLTRERGPEVNALLAHAIWAAAPRAAAGLDPHRDLAPRATSPAPPVRVAWAAATAAAVAAAAAEEADEAGGNDSSAAATPARRSVVPRTSSGLAFAAAAVPTRPPGAAAWWGPGSLDGRSPQGSASGDASVGVASVCGGSPLAGAGGSTHRLNGTPLRGRDGSYAALGRPPARPNGSSAHQALPPRRASSAGDRDAGGGGSTNSLTRLVIQPPAAAPTAVA